MHDLHNRRAFLRAVTAAGVAWAAADLVEVDHAIARAAQHAAGGTSPAMTSLTRTQADTISAAAARILPSVDGRPGARDAGVVYFIDKALSTFNAGQKQAYVDGITDLNRRAAARTRGADFVALDAAEQDEILREIEKTPFFAGLRFDTIVGMFALPSWGGNRDYAGWHLIGFEHQPRFQAPFGYYDADVNGRR
jgi:gluconate 2-dehydrogenase gamma chain